MVKSHCQVVAISVGLSWLCLSSLSLVAVVLSWILEPQMTKPVQCSSSEYVPYHLLFRSFWTSSFVILSFQQTTIVLCHLQWAATRRFVSTAGNTMLCTVQEDGSNSHRHNFAFRLILCFFQIFFIYHRTQFAVSVLHNWTWTRAADHDSITSSLMYTGALPFWTSVQQCIVCMYIESCYIMRSSDLLSKFCMSWFLR